MSGRAAAVREQLLSAIPRAVDSENGETARVRREQLLLQQRDAARWFRHLAYRLMHAAQISGIEGDHYAKKSTCVQLTVGFFQIAVALMSGIAISITAYNSDLAAVTNTTPPPTDEPTRAFAVAIVVACVASIGAAMSFMSKGLSWDSKASKLKDVCVLATETAKHLKQAMVSVRLTTNNQELLNFIISFNSREFASVLLVEEAFGNLVPTRVLEKLLPTYRRTAVNVVREREHHRNALREVRIESRRERRLLRDQAAAR